MSGLIAVTIAVMTWWFATGLVMLFARFGAVRAGMVMAIVSVIAIGGITALALSAGSASEGAAYAAFFGALAVWAWHETAFLLGLVTGPRRVGLHQSPSEKSRFRAAFKTVRDHEVVLALTALVFVVLLHDAQNTVGVWTFVLLWGMRLSAKVNIFLGAPHAVNDLLPHHLAYLESYYRTDRLSPVFAMSLILCLLTLASFTVAAFVSASEHDVVKWSLLASFAGLALIEHAFLVLPVRDSRLWTWALRICPAKTRLGEEEGRSTAPIKDNCAATAGAKTKGTVSWI
ncbi:MAG: DUF3623 family protein [Roseibium sp.]|nr:DUF3623 family protein [Roseibium sp.]